MTRAALARFLISSPHLALRSIVCTRVANPCVIYVPVCSYKKYDNFNRLLINNCFLIVSKIRILLATLRFILVYYNFSSFWKFDAPMASAGHRYSIL